MLDMLGDESIRDKFLEDWAKKSVDEINHSDFADYFSLLEARAKKNNGSNGSGMKEQQKAFIRALMKEARIDFPNLQIPDFPSISRQTKQNLSNCR